jgi:HEAT repeat protein
MNHRYATKSFIVIVILTCAFLDDVYGQATSLRELLDDFREEPGFDKQLGIAQQIVGLGDTDALPALEEWLHHEDRHIRGNAAFAFAGLGDVRGLTTIFEMLDDLSDRPLGQGMPGIAGNVSIDRWWIPAQIEADRYYAVHLLGLLGDARATRVLRPLLSDREIGYKVEWALGEISAARRR